MASPTADIHTLNASDNLQSIQALIEARLADLVPSGQTWPVRLHEAQRHALLSPGKRFRPLLCALIAQGATQSAELRKAAIDVGCVAEMVHAASLILDDLPCMDDAALRRNRPTTHIAFDESTAILSATAQMADLANHDATTSVEEVERLNRLKTGALFEFSIYSAAILTDLSVGQKEDLKDFSYHLGLGFQLLDDLKDTLMDDESAEKSVGRDVGKATILALMGSADAKRKLKQYLDAAKSALHRAGLENSAIINAAIEKQFQFLYQA